MRLQGRRPACPPASCTTGSGSGYEYVRTEYVGGEVHFTIRQPRKVLRCQACGSRDCGPHGTVERRFRTVPVGPKAVFIVFPIPRVCFPHRGVNRQVRVDFADQRRSYTKAFERFALGLSVISNLANR